MMDRHILDEARAKILWGETDEEVRSFLLSHDASRREADQAIAGFIEERLREIRRTGFRKVLIGVVLLGLSACGLVWFWQTIESGMGRRRGGIGSGVLALLLLGLFFGIRKLVDGAIYLLRPQLESKSVSDLSD